MDNLCIKSWCKHHKQEKKLFDQFYNAKQLLLKYVHFAWNINRKSIVAFATKYRKKKCYE